MPRASEKLRQVIMIVALWALLAALFLGYERYFVAEHEAFLKNAAFHSLQRIANDLQAQVERAKISTKSYVQLAQASGQPGSGVSDQTLTDFLNLYLRNVRKGWGPSATGTAVRRAKACPVTDRVPVKLEAVPRGMTASFFCTDEQNAIYTVDLTAWFKSALERLAPEFDDLIITDEEGSVLLQKSSVSSAKSSVLPRATNLRPLWAGKSDREFKTFAQASSFIDANFGGLEYKVFSVPVRIPLLVDPDHLFNVPSDAGSALAGPTWNLVVFGFRSSERFEADSHAIPYSTLIWAGLIGTAVFSLTWPLAKLRYMSSTELFTAKEGGLLCASLVIAAISASIMLLNASYTSQTRAAEDTNLAALAAKIEGNFAVEMKRAEDQLQGLKPDEDNLLTLTPNYLSAAKQQANLDPYPYFEIAFWTDKSGLQQKKFDVRPAPTPIVDLRGQPFFDGVSSSQRWDTGASALQAHYYLSPEISMTTTEFLPVLATASKTERYWLQALSLRPMSLVQPLLPPGYGFAVIDKECNVLFHSDASRNNRENFCQESMGIAELRPWLFGESRSAVDVSYAGLPERAFISLLTAGSNSLEFVTGPAFLVTIRTAEYALTLNLATVLVCVIMLSFGAVLLLLTAALLLLFREPFRFRDAARRLWPCAENGVKYGQIFAANCSILLFYAGLYGGRYEAPLLTLTGLVACFSVLFAVLRLTCPARILFRLGLILLPAAVLTVGLIAGARKLLGLSPGLEEWWPVYLFIAGAGVLAILLSGRLHGVRRVFGRSFRFSAWATAAARAGFPLIYTMAAVSVIAGISVVPSIGCFKFAYDAISELALKHDEMEVSNSLEARRDRIRSYYGELQKDQTRTIDKIAQRRITETLDRYDKAACGKEQSEGSGFEYTNEPVLDPSESSPTGCPSNANKTASDQDSITESINTVIETAIARAALVFPSNSLGSEMSKLGVARSEAEQYFFDEEEPNAFSMVWRAHSRLPSLIVRSRYLQWQGFTWRDRALLLTVFIILSVWLLKIIKKLLLAETGKLRLIRPTSLDDLLTDNQNSIVIGLPKSGKSNWLRSLPGLLPENCIDLRVHLKGIASGKPYPDPVSAGAQPKTGWARFLGGARPGKSADTADASPAPAPVVLVDEFDFNFKDRDYNLVRLNLLEHLLYETRCRLILVASLDPVYFLTEESRGVLAEDPEMAHRLLDRWARALGKFTRVRAPASDGSEFRRKLMQFMRENPDARAFGVGVREECNGTSMLRHYGTALLNEFKPAHAQTRDYVGNTMLDTATDYYRLVWSGLTASERLTLYQLALYGWANPKNTAALQQLERKSLVRRMPMYRLLNESFRRFVASPEHGDEIFEWQRQHKRSTWHAVRLMLIGLALALLVWLFHSQAALSHELSAVIGGLGTLLAALATLFARAKQPQGKSGAG